MNKYIVTWNFNKETQSEMVVNDYEIIFRCIKNKNYI